MNFTFSFIFLALATFRIEISSIIVKKPLWYLNTCIIVMDHGKKWINKVAAED